MHGLFSCEPDGQNLKSNLPHSATLTCPAKKLSNQLPSGCSTRNGGTAFPASKSSTLSNRYRGSYIFLTTFTNSGSPTKSSWIGAFSYRGFGFVVIAIQGMFSTNAAPDFAVAARCKAGNTTHDMSALVA